MNKLNPKCEGCRHCVYTGLRDPIKLCKLDKKCKNNDHYK